MYNFISLFRHPIITIKVEKRNHDGDVLQEGDKIFFDNWRFQTEDKLKAEYIRKLTNFGSAYWEDTGEKPVPVDNSPKITVSNMDKPLSEEQIKIKTLEEQMKELQKGMTQVVNLLSKPKKVVVPVVK